MALKPEEETHQVVRTFMAYYLDHLYAQTIRLLPAHQLPALTGASRLTLDEAMESPLAQDWLTLALYAIDAQEAAPEEIRRIAADLTRRLFRIPDLPATAGGACAPAAWADSPMGQLYYMATAKADNDPLITLTEAARASGITLSGISKRVTRGTLRSYSSPVGSPSRKARKFVRLSEVLTP